LVTYKSQNSAHKQNL